MGSGFRVSRYSFLLLISMIFVLGLLLLPMSSRGATIIVDDDGDGDRGQRVEESGIDSR